MNYIISLSVLLIALFIRKIINYKKHKKSINYYMILTWTAVLIAELIYAVLITKIDISSGSLLVIIIFSISSIMVIPIQKLKFKHNQTNQKIAVNKYIYGFVFLLFAISNVVLVLNFIKIGNQVGFKLNIINAFQRELVGGVFGYFYMLGIPLILMLPYTKIKKKKIITIYVLIMYGIHTKRLYLFMTILIIFIQNNIEILKKVKAKMIIWFGSAMTILFHATQVLQNKSIYNKLVLLGEQGVGLRVKSILLDPIVYIVGNISNTDSYLGIQEKGDLFLQNTLYGLYTFISNFTDLAPPILKNPFIDVGFIRTNTINFIAYYIVDGGYIYAFFIALLIMSVNEFVSLKNTKWTILIYPFFLACAIMSVRQNDYMLMYFYWIWVVIFFVSSIFTIRRSNK